MVYKFYDSKKERLVVLLECASGDSKGCMVAVDGQANIISKVNKIII